MNRRLRAVLSRLAQALPVILGVVLVSFLLTRALPGDPAAYFAGDAADAASIEETRVKLGLDRSMPEQFGLYVVQLAQGDLGQSLTTGQPVVEELARRWDIPMTQTVAMGDGANDLKMMGVAALGVAFEAKPVVNAQADVAIRYSGLDALLTYLQ